jgi:hypothetical protein
VGLKWRGDEVKAKVAQAAQAAVSQTVEDAAATAAGAWPRLTGESAESIGVTSAAQRNGSRVSARWGSPLLKVLLNEVGVRGRPGLHLLRRSGDATYGHLAGRIRGRLR